MIKNKTLHIKVNFKIYLKTFSKYYKTIFKNCFGKHFLTFGRSEGMRMRQSVFLFYSSYLSTIVLG